MNQLLQDRLRPGEKVLWQGHPAGIRLMDPAFRLKNLIVWSFAVLFAAAAVWYAGFYAPAAGIEMGFAAKVSFFSLALGGYIAATPFLCRRNLEQNICYCMTTERMIAYRVKGETIRFQSRDYVDFAEASVEYLASGKANLYLGPKTFAARLELLNELLSAREEDRMMPLTFASIVDIEGACRCLPTYIKIDGFARSEPLRRAA